jgi:uncharacterized protein YjbJ (UPF0337 family)
MFHVGRNFVELWRRVSVLMAALMPMETKMDKDRVAGSAKQAVGAVKEAAGKATGDAKLKSEGAADKTAGKIQNAVGGAKDAVRDVLKK